MRRLPLLLLLAACSGSDGSKGTATLDTTPADTDTDTDTDTDSDTDTDTDTDSDTDTDTDSDTDTDTDSDTDTDTDTAMTGLTADTGAASLPDPFAGLMATCSTNYATMNLTAWYVGEVQVDGTGQVSGTETMVFYPSPDLESYCSLAPSCVVVYTLAGSRGATARSPDYDYTITGTATLDPVATDCDDTYMPSWEVSPFDFTYAVKENADGTTTVGFESSGTPFAEGHWGAGAFTYVTGDATCTPLPDAPYTPCP